MNEQEDGGTGAVEAFDPQDVFNQLMTTSEIVPDYWRLGQGDFADCILDSEGDWLIVFKACDVGHAKALMWIVDQWQQLSVRANEIDKAVKAERARIVAALDEWRKPAIFGAEEARRKNRYDLKREFNLIAEAYDKAIAIAREEGGG